MPFFTTHHHRRRRSRGVALVAAVGIVVAGPAVAVSAECWPPPVDAPVTDPFRAPACRWCPGNRGIEYGTAPGTRVRAVHGGIVSFAGVVVGTGYVVVEHPDGRRATYGGLEELAVKPGDVVVSGLVVGWSAGAVHFGLRDGVRYVDPTPFLGRTVFPVRLVPIDGTSAPRGAPRLRCDRPSVRSVHESPFTTGRFHRAAR